MCVSLRAWVQVFQEIRMGRGEEEGRDGGSRSGGRDGVSRFGGTGFEGLWDVQGGVPGTAG